MPAAPTFKALSMLDEARSNLRAWGKKWSIFSSPSNTHVRKQKHSLEKQHMFHLMAFKSRRLALASLIAFMASDNTAAARLHRFSLGGVCERGGDQIRLFRRS